MKRSFSPTVTLYELGLEGMEDQNKVPVPMVTVVVAAASVPAEESSAAAAERMGGGGGGRLESGERAEGRSQSEAVLRKITAYASACAA